MWRFQAIRLAESNYATPKLYRVLVAYLHILLSDGDAVGDSGPVGVNQEPTSEVSHPPALGMLDDLHPEARGDAAVADPALAGVSARCWTRPEDLFPTISIIPVAVLG